MGQKPVRKMFTKEINRVLSFLISLHTIIPFFFFCNKWSLSLLAISKNADLRHLSLLFKTCKLCRYFLPYSH